MSQSDELPRAAVKAAAKIRDHIQNKTPTHCDPTFMDADDQWWQIRYWPDLGLARHDTGPRLPRGKVQRAWHWAHDLLPDTYDTLDALLTALDAAAAQGGDDAQGCQAHDEPDGMLAYVRAMLNPSRDDPTWPMPSFDARDWARAFCEIAAQNGHPGIDEEWMVTWFSGALMRGFDEAQMRAAEGARDGG